MTMASIQKLNPAVLTLTLLLALFLHAGAASQAESLDDQVNEIAHQLMCPVCQGQSVAESNSNLAQDMRQIIRKQLEEGKSKDEVIAYFVNRYGETILASPPPKGVNWLLWVLPALAIVFGGLGIGIYLHKTGKDGRSASVKTEKHVTDSDYMTKLDEELKKHES
ncbi:MAG: cytochrome c-type biogenesis protein CcmH [Candidatus Dadabacteria bacterium]|nr:MAG: cytochrome c-type biogenesis protein CcmH [Candidatus Dadabacteria bacterium]